jgi:rhodanese-related sulfurtransferase
VSTIKRVSPAEAKELQDEGYVYVDVRSEAEFEQGHPAGAFNVPVMHQGTGGMQPNPDFLTVMQGAFAKDAKLLVGCRSGGRSMKAIQMLQGAGFEALVDLRTGFEGCRDPFGRVEPGWSKTDLPVESGLPEGRRYGDLKHRAESP